MKKYLCKLVFTLICVSIISGCSKTITEPEPQFLKVHLYYGFGNELNTFEQTYTKDLVANGYITVNFWLTEEEQRRIVKKLDDVDFFNFPDTLLQTFKDSIIVTIQPDHGWQFLRIAYQDNDKTVNWHVLLSGEKEQVDNFISFEKFIIEIIEAKPEYKALPEPKGGRI